MTNYAIEMKIFPFHESKHIIEIMELSKHAGIEYDLKALDCKNNLECFDELIDNWKECPIEKTLGMKIETLLAIEYL